MLIFSSLAMKVAKERKSSVLASNAVHHRVDSLTSIVALIAIGGAHVFNNAAWLDPVGGLIVSLMVIQAGFGNTLQAIYELVDVGVDEEVRVSVKRAATKALDEFNSVSSSESGTVEILGVQGIKAGQNYLMDVKVAVPSSWTIDQIRTVENTIREKVGATVRGARRIRVKFVAKEHEQPDFTEEFMGADISPRSIPEPEALNEHHDHDHGHDHTNSRAPPNINVHKRR